jgi:hypothetical protein
MASRKEEQERRRAERQAAEQAEARATQRRLMAGYIVAGALALAVVVGLVLVLASGDGGPGGGEFPEPAHIQAQSGAVHDFEPDDREGTPPPPVAQADLEKAAKAADCELQLDLPDEGNNHITESKQIPDYKTDPPASGNHNPEQQADGAYIDPVEDWYWVHALEHGRIAIQYSPELSEEDQLALKGVFDESPEAVLFFPNPEMSSEVAASAWTNLITCDTYSGAATLDAIRAFRDIYRGQGPEDVPLVTG